MIWLRFFLLVFALYLNSCTEVYWLGLYIDSDTAAGMVKNQLILLY